MFQDVLPCLPTIKPDDPGVSKEMFKLAVEMVKCFDDLEKQEHEIISKEFFNKRYAYMSDICK